MGSRSRSNLPVRDLTHSKSPTNQKKINAKVQKDLEFLSVGKSKTENQNPNVHHLKDPLTPLHRLRRFKEVRDRNLRKVAVGKKIIKRKMSVDVEHEETQEKNQNKEDFKNTNNAVKETAEKITNGESKNEEAIDKQETVEEKGSEKRGAVNGENGEITKSQKVIITEKVEIEQKEIQISLTNDINDIVNDAMKESCVENEDNVSEKDEEKDGISNENNDSGQEELIEPPVRILRRSIRVKAAMDVPQSTSTSKPLPSTSKRSGSQEKQRKSLRRGSRDSTPTAVIVSTETNRLIKSPSEGRRSLWQQRTSEYKKRKYDDLANDECNSGKKRAFGYSKAVSTPSTPSVLSPGWQFIKSPFTKFWTPRNTSAAPGQTPYKTPIPQTPYNIAELNIEDSSMAVNFDDKSLYGNLNDSEFEETNVQSTRTSSNTGWICSVM